MNRFRVLLPVCGILALLIILPFSVSGKRNGNSGKWPSTDIRSCCKIYVERDWEANPSIPGWQELGIETVKSTDAVDEFSVPMLALETQDGMKRVEKDGRIGVIRNDGTYVLKPEYDYVDFPQKHPNQWIAWAISDHQGSRFGFANKSGQVMEEVFLRVKPFSEGMAAVRSEAGWGYINEEGKLQIPCRFQIANDFSEGLAAVNLNKKWGYVDKSGKLLVDAVFDSASHFENGLARVRSGSFWGVLKKAEIEKTNP